MWFCFICTQLELLMTSFFTGLFNNCIKFQKSTSFALRLDG